MLSLGVRRTKCYCILPVQQDTYKVFLRDFTGHVQENLTNYSTHSVETSL